MKKPSRTSKPALKAEGEQAQNHAHGSALGPGEHTSLWLRPGFLIRRLHQIHRAVFMEALGGDMTPVQYGLLSILIDRPGLDQFTVAEELGIDRANVADVLKRLESRKLLQRVVDSSNKRRKLCLATREGEKYVLKHRPQMQAVQDRLIEPLTPDERVTFNKLLHKLVDANNVYGRAVLRPARGLSAGREPLE